MSLDGTYRDFIMHWATGTLGRKTKEASLSVSADGGASTLWSYAVPIASIYNGRYALISRREALRRTSLTTNKHLNRVELEVGSRFPVEAIGHVTEGEVPVNDYRWEKFLVDFDSRAEGRATPGFAGDVVPFAFADRVGELLEEYGFLRDRSFEPTSDESPMSKKWQRSGRYTKLIARIHQWSPDLVEFYLEGGPGAFIIGGSGRLLETAKATAADLQSVLEEMMRIQDLREGAKADKGTLGPHRLDGLAGPYTQDERYFPVEVQKRGTPYPPEYFDAVWTNEHDFEERERLQVMMPEGHYSVSLQDVMDGSGAIYKIGGWPQHLVPTSNSLTPDGIRHALHELKRYRAEQGDLLETELKIRRGLQLDGIDPEYREYEAEAGDRCASCEREFYPGELMFMPIKGPLVGRPMYCSRECAVVGEPSGAEKFVERVMGPQRLEGLSVLTKEEVDEMDRLFQKNYKGFPGEEPIVKSCRCGQTYTQSEWERLQSIGVQKLSSRKGLELRNCSCGSTLSMPVQIGGYGGSDEVCESCDIGAHERCTGCGCGYCLPKREDQPGERWDYKELALGIKAESEHTDNRHIAMQIAKDHLREDPHYYTKLLKAGL